MVVDPRVHPSVERKTRLGQVRGYQREGIQTFLGLRYAQPAKRFQLPEAATAWEGVYDATTFKAQCPQPAPPVIPGIPTTPGGYDEDCLFLNVYAHGGRKKARPVIVWIHGGAFTGGSANQYEGAMLAAGADAVVVTINYRLGLLGWLDASEIGPEHKDSADTWLADQIMALEWVRDTIADFGGDPGCVTIIGESAGGTSVIALCGSPIARGLFHRAVACSPAQFSRDPRPDLLGLIAKQKKLSREKAREWVVTAPIEEIIAVGRKRGLNPPQTCTGPLASRPKHEEILDRGADAPPLITGFASHEGDFFYLAMASMTPKWMKGPLAKRVLGMLLKPIARFAAGSSAELAGYERRLKRFHKVGMGKDYFDYVWTDLFRRGAITCSLATTQAGSKGYLYEIDLPCGFFGIPMRSTHTVDIALTFNAYSDLQSWGGFNILNSLKAPEIAEKWVAMLAQFARTGDPSGPLGEWPVYDTASRHSILVSEKGTEIVQDRDGEIRRKVWGEAS